MALVTVVGYPSSGKSTRAHELKTALDARQAAPDYTGEHYRVVIVSDESSHVPREAYDCESWSGRPGLPWQGQRGLGLS